MALLKLFRGTQAELNECPVSDGALLFATDTKAVYIDQDSQRIEVASVQDLGDYITQTQLTGALAAEMSEREKQDGLLEDAIADKAPLNHTHANATTNTDGFMSSEDKTKLNGIAAGANKYTLPTATSSTLGGVKTGSNITNSSGTISITKSNVTNALGYTPPTTDTDTTYSLSKSGSTIKLTGSDGTETTVIDSNTTYTLGSFGVTASADELNKLDGLATTKTELGYLDGVTSNVQTQLNGKAASSHSHSNATTSAAGFLPKLGGGTTNYLRADGTWAKPPDTNTTYSNMTGATSSAAGKAGLVPAPAAGSATRYLRSDGTWQVPPDTNTTYTLSSFGITATAEEINKLDGLATTKTELGYLDGVTSNVQTQLNGKAASSHNHSASNITSGTLAVARGGTGVTANPSMLVNLGSGSAASVFAASPRPGVTGTLPISKGGTGATTAAQARTNLGISSADDIIAIQSEEPTSSACKLWIQI